MEGNIVHSNTTDILRCEVKKRTLCSQPQGGEHQETPTYSPLLSPRSRSRTDNKKNSQNRLCTKTMSTDRQHTNDSQSTNRDRWPPFTKHGHFALDSETYAQSDHTRVMFRAHTHCIHSLRNADVIVLQSKGRTESLAASGTVQGQIQTGWVWVYK